MPRGARLVSPTVASLLLVAKMVQATQTAGIAPVVLTSAAPAVQATTDRHRASVVGLAHGKSIIREQASRLSTDGPSTECDLLPVS